MNDSRLVTILSRLRREHRPTQAFFSKWHPQIEGEREWAQAEIERLNEHDRYFEYSIYPHETNSVTPVKQ